MIPPLTWRFLALAILRSLIACGGSVEPAPTQPVAPFTYGESVEAVVEPFCAKLRDCWPDRFASQSPGGLSQCVTDWIGSSLPEARASQPAICTREQIATCADDMASISCAVVAPTDTLAVPSSCRPCFEVK